jgi:signal transduction histidine kinase
MRVDAGVPLIAVVDDGIGFDANSSGGFGLLRMGERLRLVGGDLRIGSQPGMGTTVSAEIPPACPEFGMRCE